MKKILLILCLFPILVFSQKSYKIPADSTILNNIGSGKNELVIRNATSNITGGVLTNLGNGVTAFVLGGNSARVVDTIYKNSAKDSIVFTISGIRYAILDKDNNTSTFTFTKNATKDSIIATHDGVRSAVKDSIANLTGYALQSSLDDTAITLRNIRKADTSYTFRNSTLDSLCQITVINGISYRSCGKDSVGAGSSTLALDKITDAVDSSTLNAGNYKQEWKWNSLANNTGFKLSSTSGGLSNTQNRLFEVQMSGAMPTSGSSSYAGYFKNTQTVGSGIGLYAEGTSTAINAVGNINTSTGFFINSDFSLSNTAAGSTIKAASSSRLNLRGDNLINFQNIAGTINYASINNITDNVRQSLLFNGVYSGGQFYCSATTSAMVERNSDKLIFSANSGLTANTPFTPNNIMTVYGTNSNVGIGTTTPVASAKLEVNSTTSGFLPPRMTATQASAISSPAQGLLLFVSDTNGTFTSVGWWGYNGSTWEKLNN